jgi:hypothetical protein
MLGLRADPFEFLAERLREENIHIELAKQEMRMASTLIQVCLKPLQNQCCHCHSCAWDV